MGKFSKFVNAWACCWTLFVSIIFLLPTSMPVTALTMNYASAFLVLVLLSALLYWYISGRKFYHGPIIEAQLEDSQSDNGVFANEKSEKNRDMVV